MGGLRVAMLSYRSKPHCGGQGVYVRHLSRGLVEQGHEVTVFSGPPYPDLDPGVVLHELPSLDLYREPDPFRLPRPREYRDVIDVLEVGGMLTGAFPEPLTFTLRAARELRSRLGEFDVVHDNQSLGYGLLSIRRAGLPVVATIHHPITRDRATDLAAAGPLRQLSLRRWYSFLAMQGRVARAQSHVLTVSSSSARDIATDFDVAPSALRVVPLGVQTEVFRPEAAAARVPGRVVAMASADTPLKGIDTLLAAMVDVPGAELVLVARPAPGGTTEQLVARLGLQGRVRFVSGLSTRHLAELMASAQVACVPSRYEGFSLPTLEAMACGTPLVVSRAGAIPEVVGADAAGRSACADLVPPGDAPALAGALAALLADAPRRDAMGRAGRQRATTTYSWPAVARATADVYADAIAATATGPAPAPAPTAA